MPIPELARVPHGHLGVSLVRPHLDESIWTEYFKFAFVRDPLDRFISGAFFRSGHLALFRARPRACLRLLLECPRTMESPAFRPQHTFLEGADGEIGVDFVGRTETLERDFADVCARVGLPKLQLPRLNTSDHRSASEYYDAELRERVRDFYERDIRIFEYDVSGGQRDRSASGRGEPGED